MERSPCESCSQCPVPRDCVWKECPRWRAWWLARWEKIHNFYLKYGKK